MRVAFHRLATKEYREAKRWYAERSGDVAARFRDAVDRAIIRLASRPEAMSAFSSGYRYVRVNWFPYVVVFQIDGPDECFVVALAHTSRRPNYWRRRK
jgi:toxin ParE1/3/4